MPGLGALGGKNLLQEMELKQKKRLTHLPEVSLLDLHSLSQSHCYICINMSLLDRLRLSVSLFYLYQHESIGSTQSVCLIVVSVSTQVYWIYSVCLIVIIYQHESIGSTQSICFIVIIYQHESIGSTQSICFIVISVSTRVYWLYSDYLSHCYISINTSLLDLLSLSVSLLYLYQHESIGSTQPICLIVI